MFGESSSKCKKVRRSTLNNILPISDLQCSKRDESILLVVSIFANVRMIFICSRLLYSYINVSGIGVILFYYFHLPILISVGRSRVYLQQTAQLQSSF